MKKLAIFLCIVIAISLIVLWRMPLLGSEWSKQTIYVGLLDAWYGTSIDDKAYAMWIDDDSTEGVFEVKAIADIVGVKPAFAVIADRMAPVVADSLASWQHQGIGVLLHGLRHERWKEWDESLIENDIHQSIRRLYEQGFDTAKILKIVLPPHGCNTRTIRRVIAQQKCQMISGASLINPDRHVFQLGRIAITSGTDLLAMQELLKKAYDRNAFVIFSTHSSIPNSFSKDKILKTITMAKEIGFSFDTQK